MRKFFRKNISCIPGGWGDKKSHTIFRSKKFEKFFRKEVEKMKTKYFYILIQAKFYNSNEMYAEVRRVSSSANIWNSLNNIGGLIGANIMPSKKAADEAAAKLNDQFRKQWAA